MAVLTKINTKGRELSVGTIFCPGFPGVLNGLKFVSRIVVSYGTGYSLG